MFCCEMSLKFKNNTLICEGNHTKNKAKKPVVLLITIRTQKITNQYYERLRDKK